MNFCLMPAADINDCTFLDRKVLALSLMISEGVPLRATNRRKARRNDSTDKSGTSSKWIARVVAHVRIRIYDLRLSLLHDLQFEKFLKYIGPAKSIPTEKMLSRYSST